MSIRATNISVQPILSYPILHLQVEVNTLTGETRILASDLIYDAGKSLNPAVDIGQVSTTLTLSYKSSVEFEVFK